MTPTRSCRQIPGTTNIGKFLGYSERKVKRDYELRKPGDGSYAWCMFTDPQSGKIILDLDEYDKWVQSIRSNELRRAEKTSSA